MKKRRKTLIFKTVVKVRDRAAVAHLLDLVPDSAKLRPLVRSRFAETRYDPQTKRDYWIGGDDKHVICFMITGIESDEVSKIRSLSQKPGRRSVGIEDVVSHAAHVTGGAVHLMS